MKRIIALSLIGCMLISLTGCGSTPPPTNTVPSGVMPAASDDTSTTQDNGTTETTSQGATNSGTSDYVSSDSRITPVNINNYWISDTQFDYVNYCRDQGATVKYLLQEDDGSYNYCLPEELASIGKTPLAIGAFFYFGGEKEYVSVFCPFGDAFSDQFWVSSDVTKFEPCIGTSFSEDCNVRIVIDDAGNTLSLSSVNHLPIIFEYMMVLPTNSTSQDITRTFYAHYNDND